MGRDLDKGLIWGWDQARLTVRNRLGQALWYWRSGKRRRGVAYAVVCASELVDQAGHELGRLAFRIEFKKERPRDDR